MLVPVFNQWQINWNMSWEIKYVICASERPAKMSATAALPCKPYSAGCEQCCWTQAGSLVVGDRSDR